MNASVNNKGFAVFLIVMFSIPIVSLVAEAPMECIPVEKTVWASLYTWYGVPGQPAGKWGFDEWQNNASDPANDPEVDVFSYALSTMDNLNYEETSTAYNISGDADGTNDVLSLELTFNALSRDRMYVEMNISCYDLSKSRVEFIIYYRSWSKSLGTYRYFRYNTSILDDGDISADFKIVNVACLIALNSTEITSSEYPGQKAVIKMNVTESGSYWIAINYMEGSNWKHYNEDYHAVADEEGFYYNDPPVHSATAHKAYYGGTPWPEIPSYGSYNHSKWDEVPKDKEFQYGIYDSLNRTVITAQLLLMEKGGIDVVQLMHPWSIEVAELILEIAEEINSNLTFSYYTGRDINALAEIMNRIADDPRFYKINGKAVVTWGYTGGLYEPYPVFLQKAMEAKRAYNVYLIGDLYSSRYITKEEMLYVYDCWYYYDTSAFYRHGYGDPAILNYQADGTLYPLNAWGHLDRIFGSLSSLAHGHGKDFCAIIIPGTDNTCVHDFIGQPLYDGRTGTINERANGLTYNRTWEAAIKANADFVDIVSWNELHEGTEIEPTIENGTVYVEWTKYWSDRFKN